MKTILTVMNSRFYAAGICSLCLAVVLFSAGAEPQGANKTSPKKAGAAATNTFSITEQELPLSLFVSPTNQKEGRDPFFPNSMRPYPKKEVLRTTTKAQDTEVNFSIKGISGVGSNGLVTFDGATLKEGEEGNVTTPTGKKRIRCLKIKDETTVTIEFPDTNERRELKLRTW